MRTRSRHSGYTLVELLVVLAIVGILAVAAGAYLTMPRQKPAVQNALAEMEGLINEAHRYSGATLGNVVVESTGSWGSGFKLSYRQVGAGQPDVNTMTFTAFADRAFAGVDTADTGVSTAVGSETLATALSATPDLLAEVGTALSKNLAAGGGGGVQINANNKQFMTPFCIPVVGLREGNTYPGAPAGYLVVNGSRIYKFYKSGPGAQNPWRRL
ncbi:MAG TPA: type II secretion system protein [Holophagaceae bacterium]|nr:type II secretion system protein [Holophagaceae bacterium]